MSGSSSPEGGSRQAVSGSSSPEGGLSHVDDEGRARMVDVGGKEATERVAVAEALLRVAPETAALISSGGLPKGDPLPVARVAGIQAAKRTPDLIPLCHQVALSSVEVRFEIVDAGVRIVASAGAVDRTGVEMEALVAASVAALTLYDMVKAVERGAVIERVALLSKRGGRRGDWERS